MHVKDKLHSRWTEKLEFKTILILKKNGKKSNGANEVKVMRIIAA